MRMFYTDEMVNEAKEYLLADLRWLTPERKDHVLFVFENNMHTEIPRLLALKKKLGY